MIKIIFSLLILTMTGCTSSCVENEERQIKTVPMFHYIYQDGMRYEITDYTYSSSQYRFMVIAGNETKADRTSSLGILAELYDGTVTGPSNVENARPVDMMPHLLNVDCITCDDVPRYSRAGEWYTIDHDYQDIQYIYLDRYNRWELQ